MWQQISEHLKNEPDDLAFELYNEPCKNIDDKKWNSTLKQTLKIVRQSNPERCVVIGPANWNSFKHLDKLRLPVEDKNIIASVHYYEPFHFTHQGASWVGAESNEWLGEMWTNSEVESSNMKSDFDLMYKWSQEENRPIYVGEFGAYEKADMLSRVNWTRAVKEQCDSHSFSSSYWEFCSGFGLYDSAEKKWREQLLNALQLKRPSSPVE